MEPVVGIVVIGRNEGARLRACFDSLRNSNLSIVYVDSGSNDGSDALARDFGADVVDLDPSRPFTAARARNEGVARLREQLPDLDFIQFVDGDCTIEPGWLETAATTLTGDPSIAVVCGRRREHFPERSIYNRLCDMEWNTSIGEAAACGGDAMMRAATFITSGGFRDDLIAGEEPELCFRLRAAGGRVVRLDHDMTRHDATMTRFGQWWRRAKRAGHAAAEGYALHGDSPERFNRRAVFSILFWGAVLPIIAMLLALTVTPWALVLLLGYPALFWRIYRYRRSRGDLSGNAAVYAAFTVIGKFAELTGILHYWSGCLRNRNPEPIEYKTRFTDRPPSPPKGH